MADPNTMRAVRCSEFGEVAGLRVEDVAIPSPGPGEIRMSVRNCGLNFADTVMIAGRYQVKPDLPFTPGYEASGEILEVGEGVGTFAPGDRVLGLPPWGAMAEQVVVPAARTFALPGDFPLETAAAFPIVYGTAYLSLTHRARIQPGDWLLVNGAGGGVGLAAVDLGKLLGAQVIAAAGSREKRDLALRHGADFAVDYIGEDLAARVKEITGGRGVDVAIDPVGGEIFKATLRSMAFEGRIVVIGFASGEIQAIASNHLLVKNVSTLGFYWGGYHRFAPHVLREALAQITRACVEDKIHPHICSCFALAQASTALELLLSRRSTGKVLLDTGL